MQIQCPHCQVAIELVGVVPGSDMTCPKCGSHVSSDPHAILTEAQPADDPNALEKTRQYHGPDATGEPTSASATTPPITPQRPPMIEAFGRFQLLGEGRGNRGEQPQVAASDSPLAPNPSPLTPRPSTPPSIAARTDGPWG